MTRLRWTGGQFTDGSRGFRTTGTSEHEFEDDDRVDEYLDHRSGNWEFVEDPEDATEADSEGDDVQEDGADDKSVAEAIDEAYAEAVDETEADSEGDDEISDDELVELLDGSVPDLEDELETGEYDDPDVLNRLARIEREDGDPRTTAIDAIDARRED